MFIRSAFQHVVRPLGALPAVLIAGIGSSTALFAQDLTAPEQPRLTLDTVTVEAEGGSTVQAPFLPPVAGTMIYSGKKTSVIDLDALPPITNNNYRQALAKTPGLYLSEESTPPCEHRLPRLEPKQDPVHSSFAGRHPDPRGSIRIS